ncbi:unnamed protein product, partial [Pocillopora meandrina]
GTKLQLFGNPSFGGHTKYFSASCDDLTCYFPDGVASIIVEQDSAPWQVFTEVGYEGNPKYLYPGNYDDLNELGLEKPVKSFRTAPYFSASCDDLTRYFPNGVASIIVEQDSAPWQVFTEVGYEGNPKYLYPGNYDDLNELGLEKPVKSFRTAPVSLSLITYLIRTSWFLQAFWASCDDLSSHFPEGASSIMVNKHSERWQVFTEVQ